MVTVTCVLQFADGSNASGSLSAITPDGHWPIEYRGAIHHLPNQLTATNPDQFEAFFQHLALETGGHLKITRRGSYDLCGR